MRRFTVKQQILAILTMGLLIFMATEANRAGQNAPKVFNARYDCHFTDSSGVFCQLIVVDQINDGEHVRTYTRQDIVAMPSAYRLRMSATLDDVPVHLNDSSTDLVKALWDEMAIEQKDALARQERWIYWLAFTKSIAIHLLVVTLGLGLIYAIWRKLCKSAT